jgi:hypothetical protein
LRLKNRGCDQPMRRRYSDNVLESLVVKASRPRGKTSSRPCMCVGSMQCRSFFRRHHPILFLLPESNDDHLDRSRRVFLSELTRSHLGDFGNGIMPFLFSVYHITHVIHASRCLSQRTHGGRTLGQLRLIYGNSGASWSN